jgi:hypothetical protein
MRIDLEEFVAQLRVNDTLTKYMGFGEEADAIDQLMRRLEVMEQRAMVAEARYERAVKIVSHIHSFITQEDVRLPDGRVFRFNDPRGDSEMLRGLSEAIRAVPDEINKIEQQ